MEREYSKAISEVEADYLVSINLKMGSGTIAISAGERYRKSIGIGVVCVHLVLQKTRLLTL